MRQSYQLRSIRWNNSHNTSKRRKMVSMCAVVVLLFADCVKALQASAVDQPRILIIGAGMSGLSAAERLEELGYNNYNILEATDRVGGRMKTAKFGDGWVELGAQYIHGKTNNIIYDYALKYDLIDFERTAYEAKYGDDGEYRSEDGRLIDDKFGDEIWGLLAEKLNETLEASTAMDDKRTIGAILDAIIDQDESRGPAKDAIKRKILKFYKAAKCTFDACYSLSEETVESYQYYEVCEGNNHLLKRGYSSLVDILHSSLNKTKNDAVILNSPVDRIELLVDDVTGRPVSSNKPAVVGVWLEDGTRYVADHVIVTISLGQLKHALTRSMFKPRLSELKVQAIEKMGFGTVDKIFLEFETPFWPETYNFTSYWFVSDSHCDRDITTDWWASILGFTRLHSASNVVYAWITGYEANYMEELDDARVIDECCKAIKKFTGISDLPRVKSIRRSKWKHEKYVRGSYSYLTSKAPTPNVACDVIAEPINAKCRGSMMYPAIMFAGEATHPRFFSTVHGARESGIREANRIADFYKLPSTPSSSLLTASASTGVASFITALCNLLIF